MQAYRIRDWKTHFEKAQSRVVKTTAWVSLPNKHDGKSFRRIMAMEGGMEIYAAWVLIVQVASKCRTRGVLIDADGPLTASDIAVKTGAVEKVIEKAFNVLCSKGIAWLETFDADSTLIASMSALSHTGQDRTEQDKTEQEPPTEVCPEPSSDGSKQPSADEKSSVTAKAIMVFPCVGKGPTEWPLLEEKLGEYLDSFPGVDVLSECRKARQWCIDNPSKRKTFGGVPSFLSRWLGRVQNSAGRTNGKPEQFSGLKAWAAKHGVTNDAP